MSNPYSPGRDSNARADNAEPDNDKAFADNALAAEQLPTAPAVTGSRHHRRAGSNIRTPARAARWAPRVNNEPVAEASNTPAGHARSGRTRNARTVKSQHFPMRRRTDAVLRLGTTNPSASSLGSQQCRI